MQGGANMQGSRDYRFDFIEALDEAALREAVLIPLLCRLGYNDVIEYHGTSAEKGKDIICWYFDPLKKRRYVALVVKRGDIHGAVGKSGNASEVLYQVQQLFHEPYRDIYGLSEVRLDECIIVASGAIKSTAIESVSGTIQANNLDRFVSFVDIERLVQLITNTMPEFWWGDLQQTKLLHEIRSPLVSIDHCAAVLSHYPDQLKENPDQYRRLVESIRGHVHLVHRLVESQYHLQTHDVHVRCAVVSVDPLIKHCLREFTGIHAKRSRHGIYYHDGGDTHAAWLDEMGMRQVLFNLMDNACKYSDADTPVEILLRSTETQVIVRIQDRGLGIPRDREEDIFQPFYQGSRSGIGLGLFVARRLVRAMGGDLRVTNVANPTEFSIYLRKDPPNDSGTR